jgi:Tfp pilus assembly protein PilX
MTTKGNMRGNSDWKGWYLYGLLAVVIIVWLFALAWMGR